VGYVTQFCLSNLSVSVLISVVATHMHLSTCLSVRRVVVLNLTFTKLNSFSQWHVWPNIDDSNKVDLLISGKYFSSYAVLQYTHTHTHTGRTKYKTLWQAASYPWAMGQELLLYSFHSNGIPNYDFAQLWCDHKFYKEIILLISYINEIMFSLVCNIVKSSDEPFSCCDAHKSAYNQRCGPSI
jgi:hypothetical protein